MLRTCSPLLASALFLMSTLAGSLAQASDLVVYSSRDQAEATSIIKRFETESGLDVDLVHNNSEALAQQLIEEGADSSADVIWLAEAGWFGSLARKSVLALSSGEQKSRTAPRMRASDGKWIATSGHLRALVYNPDKIADKELPGKFTELAVPVYEGKIGWNPEDPGFVAHLSALRRVWSEEKTRQWLQAVAANQPVKFKDDRSLVEAVERGEIALGLVAHHAVKDAKVRIHTLPGELDPGNMLVLSGVSIRKDAAHGEAAAKFVDFLLSESVQRSFAESNFEYPALAGMSAHKDVPPLSEVRPFAIKQAWLVDTEPTFKLLFNSGIR